MGVTTTNQCPYNFLATNDLLLLTSPEGCSDLERLIRTNSGDRKPKVCRLLESPSQGCATKQHDSPIAVYCADGNQDGVVILILLLVDRLRACSSLNMDRYSKI